VLAGCCAFKHFYNFIMKYCKQIYVHKTISFQYVFAQLSKNDLFAMVYCLSKKKLKIGDYVYRKGEPNSGLYLIKKGT
jgi:hypothetical protein